MCWVLVSTSQLRTTHTYVWSSNNYVIYFIPYTFVPPLDLFPILSNVDMNELSECQKLQTYGVDGSITSANKYTWLSHHDTHNQSLIILKYHIAGKDNEFCCFRGFYLNHENYFLKIFAGTNSCFVQSNWLFHMCGNLRCCCTSTLQ